MATSLDCATNLTNDGVPSITATVCPLPTLDKPGATGALASRGIRSPNLVRQTRIRQTDQNTNFDHGALRSTVGDRGVTDSFCRGINGCETTTISSLPRNPFNVTAQRSNQSTKPPPSPSMPRLDAACRRRCRWARSIKTRRRRRGHDPPRGETPRRRHALAAAPHEG